LSLSTLKHSAAAGRILKRMLEQAKEKIFPDKEFIVYGRPKGYTSYLHFTNSIADVTDPTANLQFQCIFCPALIKVCIGATSNVLKHIKKHRHESADLDIWLKLHSQQSSSNNKVILDVKLFNLIKFYIFSNMATYLFENIHFTNLFDYDIPCARTLTDSTLAEVSFNY